MAPKTMFEHDAKLDVGVRVRRDRPSARRGSEGAARALARRESIPLGATYPKVRCTGPEGGLQAQARALAEEFVELHGKRFPKAAGVFEAVIGGALSYPEPPTAGSIKVDPYAIIGG